MQPRSPGSSPANPSSAGASLSVSRRKFSPLSQTGRLAVSRSPAVGHPWLEVKKPRDGRGAMFPWGAIVGLWSLLIWFARGEPIPETACPGGQSWSLDLEKCMDCSVCQHQNKNDFCSTCGDPQPADKFKMWLLVGASLGAVLLATIIGGIIAFTRCRRREKFTTPIEETGGHSAQESLIH